jgi:ankyrin repeat protein
MYRLRMLYCFYLLFLTLLTGCGASLIKVSAEGDYTKVEAKLAQGANINKVDEDGLTALSHSAYQGHSKVVQLLLDHGADVNIADKKGYTPLIWAISREHFDIVKPLLDKGVDVNLGVAAFRLKSENYNGSYSITPEKLS